MIRLSAGVRNRLKLHLVQKPRIVLLTGRYPEPGQMLQACPVARGSVDPAVVGQSHLSLLSSPGLPSADSNPLPVSRPECIRW